jgi:hypothetical protein
VVWRWCVSFLPGAFHFQGIESADAYADTERIAAVPGLCSLSLV